MANGKPLPKIATRILDHPGINSLHPPGESLGSIHWHCWAADGWSAPDGSDGCRETALARIERWAKSLRGPNDPERRRTVLEIARSHINDEAISDDDILVLQMYLEKAIQIRSGYGGFFQSGCIDSIDSVDLDESLAAAYNIPPQELDAVTLVIAIADLATESTKHRDVFAQLEAAELEGEAAAEAAALEAAEQPYLGDEGQRSDELEAN